MQNNIMKNIHVLKTDKPSKLLKDLVDGSYQFKKEVLYGNRFELPSSIYITSDEEIKDVRLHNGKWHLEKGNILNKFPDYLTDLSECKLVIMTTDQDLIEDGVQAISDEFLEWFVKNPSCELVYVRFFCCGGYDDKCEPKCLRKSYEIIIPKEEPKQVGQVTEKGIIDTIRNCPNCGVKFHIHKNITEPKQETIEEAAERMSIGIREEDYKDGFIEGAKWQQQQMYSDNFYSDLSDKFYESKLLHDYKDCKIDYRFIRNWFIEQFKNK